MAIAELHELSLGSEKTLAFAQCEFASYVSSKQAAIPFIESGFASSVNVAQNPRLIQAAAYVVRRLVSDVNWLKCTIHTVISRLS